MSQQRLAIYEDESDALRDLVTVLGGYKAVGALLRPDLSADRAGQWLRDCLNPERAERLQPSQLFHLLRLGHDKGVHAPCEYILGNAGYAVQPIEPESELARLEREFITAVGVLKTITPKIEEQRAKLRAA